MTPPIKPAVTVPPNMSPVTVTPMPWRPVSGFSPRTSAPTSNSSPVIEPDTFTLGSPLMPVTSADTISLKSSGLALMLRHWMPISVGRMGSHSGHLSFLGSMESAAKKTPKPARVWRVPSLSRPKLVIVPPSASGPAATETPSASNPTTGLMPVAVVSTMKFLAETTIVLPNFSSPWSTFMANPVGTLSVNFSVARTPSLSLSDPSVSDISNFLPGNSTAFLAATKKPPSTSSRKVGLKETSMSCKPPVRSSSRTIEPKSNFPALVRLASPKWKPSRRTDRPGTVVPPIFPPVRGSMASAGLVYCFTRPVSPNFGISIEASSTRSISCESKAFCSSSEMTLSKFLSISGS